MGLFDSLSGYQEQFQTFAAQSSDTLQSAKYLVGDAQATFDGQYFQPVTPQQNTVAASSSTTPAPPSPSPVKVSASGGFFSKWAVKFGLPVWSVVVIAGGLCLLAGAAVLKLFRR